MSFVQPRVEVDPDNKFDTKEFGNQWLGTLMLFFPKEVKPEFDTGKFKPTDVVVSDIIFVDGPQAGRFFHETFVFSKPIVGALKGNIGQPVLGRFSQKQYTEGTGWYLAEFTDADQALALPVLNQYQAGKFQQPAATTVAPTAPTSSAWNLPPAPVQAPGTPAPAAVAQPGIDAQTLAKLHAAGINAANLDPQQAALIAATLP